MKNYNDLPEAEESAFWIRESKTGKKFISGTVKFDGQDIRVVAFVNDKRTAENKQPAFSYKAAQVLKQSGSDIDLNNLFK
jgi:hypothetical protein